MSTISIRALRSDLAVVVRRAEAGEATVVTVAGRPVAQLAPLDRAALVLPALIATGAVVAPRRTSIWRPPAPVPVAPGTRLDRAVAEVR